MKKKLLMLVCVSLVFAGCSKAENVKVSENKKEQMAVKPAMNADEQKIYDKFAGKLYIGEYNGILRICDQKTVDLNQKQLESGGLVQKLEVGDLIFSRMQIPPSSDKEPTTVEEKVRLQREAKANAIVVYKNARVKNENGVLYLTADNFPYRVEIGEDGFRELEEDHQYKLAPTVSENK